jgi:hypothetical protein
MSDVIEVRCVRDDTVWIKFDDGAHGEVDTSLLHPAPPAARFLIAADGDGSPYG